MSTAETEDTKASEAKASPQDLVLKVLGAIGTGVGVLGFVAFFGGAVLWLRAEKADLPANDAVSVIPKSVLVTTGASFLVPAVLIALLAVVLIFAVYIVANLPRQNSARQASSEADDLWREVDALREAAESKADQAKATQALLASASGEAAAALLPVAQTHNAEEIEAKRQYHVKKAAAEERSEAAKGKLTQTPVQFRVELWVGFVAVLLAPLIFNKAIFSVDFFFSGLILALTALAAAAASAVVYLSTQKLIWFGITAFVTVGIYIGFATYYSTTRNLKVEPAAALRGERAPVVGSFIADTASNLYLGTFPEGRRRPRLIVVPRSQVTALTIGPLTDPNDASGRAVEIALAECRQEIDLPKTDNEPAHIDPACTSRQRSILESRLASAP